VGSADGLVVGRPVGADVGSALGSAVGSDDGVAVGTPVWRGETRGQGILLDTTQQKLPRHGSVRHCPDSTDFTTTTTTTTILCQDSAYIEVVMRVLPVKLLPRTAEGLLHCKY